MSDIIVVIIRGAPAVGKSTISKLLQNKLIKLTKHTVTYLPWDTFFNFIEPNEKINDHKILNSTRVLAKTAEQIVALKMSFFIIIEGVFIFDEEINLLNRALIWGTRKVYWVKLEAPIDIQLKRNKERDPIGFVGEERIAFLSKELKKQKAIKGELLLNTGEHSAEETVDLIINNMLDKVMCS